MIYYHEHEYIYSILLAAPFLSGPSPCLHIATTKSSRSFPIQGLKVASEYLQQAAGIYQFVAKKFLNSPR